MTEERDPKRWCAQREGKREGERASVWRNGLWLQGLPLVCISQGRGTVLTHTRDFILFLGQTWPLIQGEATSLHNLDTLPGMGSYLLLVAWLVYIIVALRVLSGHL